MTNALYKLLVNQQWQVTITHIQSLADGDTADQLFFQCDNGMTAITWACYRSAPLELVQLMITKAKLDPRKRCMLAITANGGWTVLHYAVCYCSDPAVLELLIREHPLALCATYPRDRNPHPLQPRPHHLPPHRHHRCPRLSRLRRPPRPCPPRRAHDPPPLPDPRPPRCRGHPRASPTVPQARRPGRTRRSHGAPRPPPRPRAQFGASSFPSSSARTSRITTPSLQTKAPHSLSSTFE